MSASTRWGNWIVCWGILDLYTFGRYFLVKLVAGEIPFFSDFKKANITAESFGTPFPLGMALLWTIIFLSLLVSGILLVRRRPVAAILVYIQTPFRFAVVTPSIISLLPATILDINLMPVYIPFAIGVEAFKVVSVVLWRKGMKRDMVKENID